MRLFGALSAVRPTSESTGESTGDTGESTDVFTYRCVSCEAEFDLPKTRMVGVRCPDCRSANVRIADEA